MTIGLSMIALFKLFEASGLLINESSIRMFVFFGDTLTGLLVSIRLARYEDGGSRLTFSFNSGFGFGSIFSLDSIFGLRSSDFETKEDDDAFRSELMPKGKREIYFLDKAFFENKVLST